MPDRWTLDDARELYNVAGWSQGLFDVGAKGTVEMCAGATPLDLKQLLDDLVERGIDMPVLVRFSDVLRARVDALAGAFHDAIAELGYGGVFRGVYPIKVNQQRQVVEEVVRFGRPHSMGLECGSKPELMVVLAELEDPDALIICNGYKDADYVEMALIGRKLGRNCVLVVEQLTEVEAILRIAQELGIEPLLGVRTRLGAVGTGRWKSSSGDRAKFGLSADELVAAVHMLRDFGFLDSLRLLHFHIGSQVSSIRRVRDAVREATRIYSELCRMGARMGFLDVGGGLGIDYDGSRTNFDSSMNYDLPEYARTIVGIVQEICDAAEVAHPAIVTEAGRALVAHSSMLIVPVLEVSHRGAALDDGPTVADYDSLGEIREIQDGLTARNPQETFHTLNEIRDQTLMRFDMGLCDLEERAAVEAAYWATCRRLWKRVVAHGGVPEELEPLERRLADTYYCNFSVFQSLPDSWAIDQLFPILPLHRLLERPTRRGVLVDITCDSDGRVDRFVDLKDVKRALELHRPNDEPYYLGVFLLGAYQEILGDLHNLFGDTNVVHVLAADTPRGYRIEAYVEGDTVAEVLRYVQYDHEALLARVRQAVERAYDSGALDVKDGSRLLKTYKRGLGDYTYLG